MKRSVRVSTTVEQPEIAAPQAKNTISGISWVALCIGGVLIVGLVIGLIHTVTAQGQATIPSSPAIALQMSAPSTPTIVPSIVPTATPSCTSGARYLSIIATQELNSQWEVAAENAEAALRDPELCAQDITTLQQKSITDGLEAVYQQQFAPWDITAQEDHVRRYHTLGERAQAYGVSFPSALQVATRVYSSGQFLLAKTAFEEAFTQHHFDTRDQGLLQQYVATLYNLGIWRTTNTTGEVYQEGLQLFVACHLVDVRYNVGSGACQGKLAELIGPDQREWPQPSSTPFLDDVSH